MINSIEKRILIVGSILGLLAVILGAFGAHGLKSLVSPEKITSFETGVRYQMLHALLLLFIGMAKVLAVGQKRLLFMFVFIGVLLFSGSIYLLSMNELMSFDFKKIGFVTPIGGTILIVGWVLLTAYFFKLKTNNK